MQQVPATDSVDRSLDVRSLLHDAAKQVKILAPEIKVRFEVAVQPGLAMSADPDALQSALVDVLLSTVGDGLCQHVLLTGTHRDGWVRIAS